MGLRPTVYSLFEDNMDCENLKGWFSLLIAFRLAFRSLIFLDLELAPVFFLNIPLFLKMPSELLLLYLLGMLSMEVYLILSLRKGNFPPRSLLVYFGTATILEFPYVPFKGLLNGDFSGVFFFVIPWYLSTLVGLMISLKLLFRKS